MLGDGLRMFLYGLPFMHHLMHLVYLQDLCMFGLLQSSLRNQDGSILFDQMTHDNGKPLTVVTSVVPRVRCYSSLLEAAKHNGRKVAHSFPGHARLLLASVRRKDHM